MAEGLSRDSSQDASPPGGAEYHSAASKGRQPFLYLHFDSEAIRQRLNAAIERAGLSSSQLAGAVSVSRQLIEHYRSGRRPVPPRRLPALATALGVPYPWLAFGQDVEIVPRSTWDELTARVAELEDGLRRLQPPREGQGSVPA